MRRSPGNQRMMFYTPKKLNYNQVLFQVATMQLSEITAAETLHANEASNICYCRKLFMYLLVG